MVIWRIFGEMAGLCAVGPTKKGTSKALKILFTSTHLTSFMKEDLALLGKYFSVQHLTTNGLGSLVQIPLSVRNADVTFTWFASTYSAIVVFVAKRTKRKSVIVIGGADAAKCPEIGYGVWLSLWKSVLVRYAITNADKVLAVDPYLQKEIIRLAAYDGANSECVPTGYDADEWAPSGEKEPFVLTVAKSENEARVRVKGLDMLFSTALQLPDIRFVVIGLSDHLLASLRKEAPDNVEIISCIEKDALLGYYQRAKVYCQPSYIEGLPNSVCEAMLCECVPVGTNVGGIPTAIGEHGFLVQYADVAALSEAIRQALAAPKSAGGMARRYIAETFPLERRKESLVRIMKELAT